MFFSKTNTRVEDVEKYRCVGVNYFDLLEIDDTTKETLFKDFEKAKKVFTDEELVKISGHLGYDVKRAFSWVPISFFKRNNTLDLTIEYRFKRKAKAHLSDEDFTTCLNEIRIDKSYDRSEIETLSVKFGFSVYDRLVWETIKKITLKSPDISETYTYFEKR